MRSRQLNYLKPLARTGYAARGLIYFVIGIFALGAAFWSTEKKDTKGAVGELLELPMGTLLIVALLAGLIGYVAWRLVQAIFDTDDHGLSPVGAAVRLGLLASAATYSTLALYTLSIIGAFGSGSSGRNLPDYMAAFIGNTWTALVLCIVFAGVAAAHFWKAYMRKYREHIEAETDAMAFIDLVSRTGLTARGLVLAVISILFFKRFSASGAQPGEPDLMSALTYIQQLPAGRWLLALTGLGLLAFAAYSAAESYWRRINVHDA